MSLSQIHSNEESRVHENIVVRAIHHPSTAWIILLCSIALTILAWYISNRFVNARANDRFDFQIQDIKKAINERMQEQERALRGGVGLFTASEIVQRNEWKAYVDSLNLAKNYPGLQGFGFSQVILPKNKSAHIRQIRSEGYQRYSIRPEGKREVYTSIIFLEPFDWRNQRAFGYDMFSEPTRREAMARARDTGEAAVSGMVKLVQETERDIQHGFLMYLPVYQHNLPVSTTEERRVALKGYVYSPFRMKDLMQGILGARDTDIEFEIYDGVDIKPETLMYDSNNFLNFSNKKSQPEFHAKNAVTFGGRTWSLYFNAKEGYISSAEASQPMVVAFGGAIIDILLFLIIASISRQHIRVSNLLALTQHDVSEQAIHTQTIANTVVDGIITIDEQGTINFVNPAVTKIFGYSINELLGHNVKMLMPEPDRQQHDGYLHAYMTSGNAKIIGNGREVIGKRRDGTVFPLELAVNAMERNGSRFYVGTLRDVTERHESSEKIVETIKEMELRAQEMTLLSGLNDLLQTCQDLDEIYMVISRVMTQMFDDLSGVLYVISDNETNLVLACQWNNADEYELIERKNCLAIRRGAPYLSTDNQPILKCQHFREHTTPMSFCIPLTAQSTTIGLLTLFDKKISDNAVELLSPPRQDLVITVSKQISIALANLRLRKKLEQQSIHDPLTGLHNRRFLQEILPKEIQRALRREDPRLAILMIDVDHFKKVNDTHGHDAGDRVLRELARILKALTRNEDIVCRLGGEEFIVVLPTMDIQGAIGRANKLRNELKKTRIDFEGIRMAPVTISIGVACLPEHGKDEETLLRLSDQALYAAKSAGRDCIIISGMDEPGSDAATAS